jgi:broad specificity phosphatase PhoE
VAGLINKELCSEERLVQIVLLRHGKPKIRTDLRLSAAEWGTWVAEYNAAGIDPEVPPPESAIEKVKSCSFAVCSDLERSRKSADALGIERVSICESMFRELDMPHAGWRYPRLSLVAWAVIFRLMWALGYSRNSESFREGRARARLCAERLAEMAAEHESVVFVGHGALIWFVSRNLNAMGWSGPKRPPRKHWEFGVYLYEGT